MDIFSNNNNKKVIASCTSIITIYTPQYWAKIQTPFTIASHHTNTVTASATPLLAEEEEQRENTPQEERERKCRKKLVSVFWNIFHVFLKILFGTHFVCGCSQKLILKGILRVSYNFFQKSRYEKIILILKTFHTFQKFYFENHFL